MLQFFTDHNQSLMERLQQEFPDAHFVKAFNSVGSACMVNPQFKGGKPTMFICGNDDAAKQSVVGILNQFGWETADMGRAEAARHRTALHALVHPRLPAQRLGSRV